jgi:hypothetical protein
MDNTIVYDILIGNRKLQVLVCAFSNSFRLELGAYVWSDDPRVVLLLLDIRGDDYARD